MKVNIKNYQSIKEAELEFEKGLTVIVGSSNNGKSSIIRAIESAINNKGGSDFINYGSDSCQVVIEDGRQNIVWSKSRNSSKSYYEINGEVLNKIGQKQIEDVGNTLRMSEIVVNNDKFRLNFWKQLDFPFLVGKTHYQLFDFISKSKDQEIMSNLLNDTSDRHKDTKKELSEVNTEINTRTKDIASLEGEIAELSKYEEFDIDAFEKLVHLVKKIKDAKSLYEELPSKIETQKAAVQKINVEIDKKHDIIKRTESLMSEIKEIEPVVSRLKDMLLSIETTDSKILRSEEGIDKINEELKKESKALGAFEICPFCQQKLDKNHGGHNE